jgi:hypothetical protein
MGDQTAVNNRAYTDKQAELAKRLVLKYQRQLANLNPPIYVPDNIDQFRLGIRHIDRSKRAYIEDGVFKLHFPYDPKLIDAIKRQGREGFGAVEFDNDARLWKLAMTESMLNWVVTVGQAHIFSISDDVMALYEAMLETEKSNYSIELVETDSSYTITNAATELLDHINTKLGGFGRDNLTVLVDNAAVLGYTVSPAVAEAFRNSVDDKEHKLFKDREVRFRSGEITLSEIIEYGRKVNRLPVYVYETGVPGTDTDEIKYLNRNKTAEVAPKLLVSMTSMMIGSKKDSWKNNAEKIIIIQ